MYKELLAELTKENRYVKIQSPCPEKEIKRAQEAVGHKFPKELADLLGEMNGDGYCLLSADEIVKNAELNRELLPLFLEDFSREEYVDRVERFIFFASNGCGDYYCYRLGIDGTPEKNAVYIWEHENIGEKCCWRKVADNMAEFITRYYSGEI